MRRMRSAIAAAVGMLLTATALVAPAAPAVAATASGTITVAPGQLITAKFKDTKLDKKRVVLLESSADGLTGWTDVTEAKMTAKGAVTFSTIATNSSYYRATAKAFNYTSKKKKVTAAAVSTPAKQVAITWQEEFSGSTLDEAKWRQRTEVGYQAKGRHCAAPIAANTTVGNGSATLKVTEVKNGTAKNEIIKLAKEFQAKEAGSAYTKALAKVNKEKAALAKAEAKPSKTKAQKKSRDKAIKDAKKKVKSAETALSKLTPGCPNGVFENGMITAGSHTISAGTVVARVKFPIGQGAHAGVWLQDNKTRQEIDIIESYGHGRGITNIVHRLKSGKLVKDPAQDSKGYVAAKTVKSTKWWSQWHTVAVTFNSSKITFYLDGVKTKELAGMTGNYSLMVSLLSSDWETYRVKKPDARPGSGLKKSAVKKRSLPSVSVDWIRMWEK